MIAGNSKRRKVAQQKTPLSKLLTSNEMAEFKRVLGGNQKLQRPGDYFNNGPPTREQVVNQVSASRVLMDPQDLIAQSRLELHKSSMSGFL